MEFYFVLTDFILRKIIAGQRLLLIDLAYASGECLELLFSAKKLIYTIVYSSIQVIFMEATTIKIDPKTKKDLDQFKEYKNETYDEVLRKVIYIAKTSKKSPSLSKQTVLAIEEARERLKKGHFVTEEEARKRLGF